MVASCDAVPNALPFKLNNDNSSLIKLFKMSNAHNCDSYGAEHSPMLIKIF